MYDRFYAASDKPVLASAIASHSAGKSALRSLLRYYADIDRKMQDAAVIDGDDVVPGSTLLNFPRLFGWPDMSSTRFVYSPRKPLSSKDNARYRREMNSFARRERSILKAISDFSNSLESALANKNVKTLMNWKHVFFNSGTNHTTRGETHKCIVLLNFAYKINNVWSVGASVTNDRRRAHLKDRERIFLVELFNRTKDGSMGFQPYFLDINFKPKLKYWGDRPFKKGSKETFIRTSVSSLVYQWIGQGGIKF